MRNPILGLNRYNDRIDQEYQFLTLASMHFDVDITIIHGYFRPYWVVDFIPNDAYWMFNIGEMSKTFKERLHFVQVMKNRLYICN